MPTVMEANGEIWWSREVTCPECGEDWESFNQDIPESGGIELCPDCEEEDER